MVEVVALVYQLHFSAVTHFACLVILCVLAPRSRRIGVSPSAGTALAKGECESNGVLQKQMRIPLYRTLGMILGESHDRPNGSHVTILAQVSLSV